MEGKKAIIFITTPDRSNFEWTQFWGFNPDKSFYLRKMGDASPGWVDSLDLLLSKLDTPLLVIWMNGRMVNGNLIEQINKMLSKLKGYEILIASHGRWDTSNLSAKYKVSYSTTLTPNVDRFLKPLVSADGSKFAQTFDSAWNFLLRTPATAKLEFLAHRLKHVLDPLAIDLQGLRDCAPEKRLEYASKIIEEYKSRPEHSLLRTLLDLRLYLSKKAKPVQITVNKQQVTLKTTLTESNLPETEDGKRWSVNEEVIESNSSNLTSKFEGLKESLGFKSEGWDLDTKSKIVKFLISLDDAMAKSQPSEFCGIALDEQQSGAFFTARKALYDFLDDLASKFGEGKK